MLTKKICKAVVSALSICALIAVSILPCYAGWVGTSTAADWWNFQTSTCSLYYYDKSGFVVGPAPTLNPHFKATSYDIEPYVEWTSVSCRYISTTWAGIEHTFSDLPDDASMFGIRLEFFDEWFLIAGRTYEFVILRNAIDFYNMSGVDTSTQTQISEVYFSSLKCTIEDKYIGTNGFDRAIRCVVTPTVDTSVSSISVICKSKSNVKLSASKLHLNLAFSDVVSYTGNLDTVVVNPTLDNIDKQVEEINNKIDSIKGDPSQDTAPGLDGLESQGQEANDALDDLLHGIDVPDGKEHWSQAMQLFKDINLLAAFQWWGLCFDYVSAHALLSYLSLFSCLIMLLLSVFGCYRSAVFRLNSENRNAEKEVTATYYSEVHRAGAKNYRVQDRVRTTTYRRGRAVRTRENVNISFRKEE